MFQITEQLSAMEAMDPDMDFKSSIGSTLASHSQNVTPKGCLYYT